MNDACALDHADSFPGGPHDGDHLNAVGQKSVHQSVRRLDQFANVDARELRHEARLTYSAMPPKLVNRVLRPAERQSHEARRMRERMLASASSWDSIRPACASARPASIACGLQVLCVEANHASGATRVCQSCAVVADRKMLFYNVLWFALRWRWRKSCFSFVAFASVAAYK